LRLLPTQRLGELIPLRGGRFLEATRFGDGRPLFNLRRLLTYSASTTQLILKETIMEKHNDSKFTNTSLGERNGTVGVTNRKGRRGIFKICLILAVIGGLATWRYFVHQGSTTTPIASEQPIPVTVQTLHQQSTRLWSEFSGRLKAINSAEIRPEVSGRIVEIRFVDGQSVEAGAILMVIDPRSFEAAEARAKARMEAAKAALQFATLDQARNSALLGSRAIAQRDADQADSAKSAAVAEILAAEADIKTAEIDLDHAYIKAPISGRISRAELTLGNLVQAGPSAPLLTTIVSEKGIYADFEVDEQTYLQTIHEAATGNEQEGQIPVELITAILGEPAQRGFIQSFDNRLDSGSGTIRVRAKFDNAAAKLVPGMFVSIKLASGRPQDLIFIDDRAVGFDQSKEFVLVVSPDNRVEYREVELGGGAGGQRFVLKGLRSGERIIVEGLQRVRAKALVTPTEMAPVSTASLERPGIRPQPSAVARSEHSRLLAHL
jgi:membrane fusion protein, multidrug efflux system